MADETPETPPKREPKDGVVELVARFAETGVGIAITVCIPGAVITGTTMSAKDYFEGTGKIFAKGAGDLAAELEEMWSSFGRPEQDEEPEDESEDAPLKRYDFLHLKDAKVVMGQTFAPVEGTLIRIRIAHVSAFSWGSWGAKWS